MNCRFLHHWRYKWVEFFMRARPNRFADDQTYKYWRGECIFCGLLSNRAASEPPSERER